MDATEFHGPFNNSNNSMVNKYIPIVFRVSAGLLLITLALNSFHVVVPQIAVGVVAAIAGLSLVFKSN